MCLLFLSRVAIFSTARNRWTFFFMKCQVYICIVTFLNIFITVGKSYLAFEQLAPELVAFKRCISIDRVYVIFKRRNTVVPSRQAYVWLTIVSHLNCKYQVHDKTKWCIFLLLFFFPTLCYSLSAYVVCIFRKFYSVKVSTSLLNNQIMNNVALKFDGSQVDSNKSNTTQRYATRWSNGRRTSTQSCRILFQMLEWACKMAFVDCR